MLLGLEAKVMSWVLRNSSAVSGEDITMVGTCPSFKDIIGPYFAARDWRVRCGNFPSMWRWPITGRGLGPGGCFPLSWPCFAFNTATDTTNMNTTRSIAGIASVSGNISDFSWLKMENVWSIPATKETRVTAEWMLASNVKIEKK